MTSAVSVFSPSGEYIPAVQPPFDSLSGAEQIELTVFWALADAMEQPTLRELRPLTNYTKAMYEIAKVVGKHQRSPFDRDLLGTGLTGQRKIRASAA